MIVKAIKVPGAGRQLGRYVVGGRCVSLLAKYEHAGVSYG
jgi:hypothetical protein